ncbi:MAG: ATP-dependent helicase UvrD/PcrA, partial [Patescibacteria group bacterium]|nr:ATP-dependent helicase UvrD/PcrA [Patescibacteria group bacterium]
LNIKGLRKYEALRDSYLNIYQELNTLLENYKDNKTAKFLSNTLALEIKQSEETGKASNLTAWKDEYFTKGEDGNLILKDSKKEKIEKWLGLAGIYKDYNKSMHNKGLYDFDDMIFKVSRELLNNTNLRNELEEKYQYIMIDEFQDTSDSQFALIQNLTLNPVNEGRPNVLVVGDDDQAIFKFQGAELDNITRFVNMYKDVNFITLDKNYRSTQGILDHARSLITKIDDRLEVRFPSQINKNIIADNQKLLAEKEGKIIEKSFDNIFNEMDYIATEIKDLIQKGASPNEITVISRSHSNLRGLSSVFNQHNIPYSYEKRENVFDKQPIKEILTIITFVDSSRRECSEDLLPEILSYKFWNIDRVEIWKIAEKVKSGSFTEGELGEKVFNRPSWLQVMLDSEKENIKRVAEFLIELMADSTSLPLSHLLDKIIGTKEWERIDEVDDEDSITEIKKYNFTSPFRDYYFGKDNFDHRKPEYLELLFALRTFMGALREYKIGQILYAKDMKDFVQVYDNNSNLTLNLVSPFATSENAVILQTAHKSKGLEYEYVFIINSDEQEWNGRKRQNKIGVPISLPLLPSSDDISDMVRLYYVAMTRAKHTLYITHNKDKFSVLDNVDNDTNNQEDGKSKKENDDKNILSKEIVDNLYVLEKKPFIEDEIILLKRLLENYKMSVTHLINYLNISKVGPSKFIEQNLLHFPQAMSPSSIYGTAMHEALQLYYLHNNKYNQKPEKEKVISFFENALKRGGLSNVDYQKYYDFGVKNLTIYLKDLEQREIDNKTVTKVEVDFKNEGVNYQDAILTGKIDKLEIVGNKLKVTDFKTGKSFEDWDSGSGYDKIKLHFFRYQLAFYKILLNNSRTYNNDEVVACYIEFLEASKKENINILELVVDEELLTRVKKLIEIIYHKIINLDFPSTDKYLLNQNQDKLKEEATVSDIISFEDDLINKII